MNNIERLTFTPSLKVGDIIEDLIKEGKIEYRIGFDYSQIQDCGSLHAFFEAEGLYTPVLAVTGSFQNKNLYTPVYIPLNFTSIEWELMEFCLVPEESDMARLAYKSRDGVEYVWTDIKSRFSRVDMENRIKADAYNEIKNQENQFDTEAVKLSWEDDSDFRGKAIYRSGMIDFHLDVLDDKSFKKIFLKKHAGRKLISAVVALAEILDSKGINFQPHDIFSGMCDLIEGYEDEDGLSNPTMFSDMLLERDINDVIIKFCCKIGVDIVIYSRAGYDIFPISNNSLKPGRSVIVYDINKYCTVSNIEADDVLEFVRSEGLDSDLADIDVEETQRSDNESKPDEENDDFNYKSVNHDNITRNEGNLYDATPRLGPVSAPPLEVETDALEELEYYEEPLGLEEEYITDESCCYKPVNLSSDNIGVMSWCLKDFEGKSPRLNCLHSAMSNANSFMDLLLQKSSFGPEDLSYINNYAHFRHDFLTYIILNFIRPNPSGVSFGTDFKFPFITSNKTPDYIEISGDKVVIYEMTVVTNYNRGLFMKGFNKETSVYKDQIKELISMGKEVVYFPVIVGIAEGLDTNLTRLSYLFNKSIEGINKEIFKDYFNHLKTDYNSLIAMDLAKGIHREHLDATNKINKMMSSSPWIYKSISVNKINWYRVISCLKTTVIDKDFNFKISLTKQGAILRRSGLGVKGSDIIKNKEVSVEHCAFKLFYPIMDNLKGNDEVFVITDEEYKEDLLPLTDHGMISSNKLPSHRFGIVNNFKMSSVFGLGEIKSLNEMNLNTRGMDGLNHKMTRADVVLAVNIYKEKLNFENQINHNKTPPSIYDPRRSFQALADGDHLATKNISDGLDYSIIDDLKSLSAKLILSKSRDRGLKFGYEKVFLDEADINSSLQKLRLLNKEYHSLMIDKNKSIIKVRVFIKKFPELKDKVNELCESRRILQRSIKSIDKKQILNRLQSDKDINMAIKDEMRWSKNSGYKIFGNIEDSDINSLEELQAFLWTKGPMLKDGFEIPEACFDSEIFIQIKERYNSDLYSFRNELIGTHIYNNLLLLSQLAYTLLSVSNQTTNGNYITLDNIGLTNCYLMVKGGGKMTRTRKTKIFKLIYPCYSSLSKWNTSKRTFQSNGVNYEETPWQQWHQSMVLDYLAAPYKMMLAYTTVREKYDIKTTMEMLSLPLMLLLHNRRKTEETLHNLRYILANTLAEFTQIKSMLPVFATVNYTFFEACLKKNLELNYQEYFDSVRVWADNKSLAVGAFKETSVKHPLLNRNIHNIDDFTFLIYGTYMMTKAPIEQTIEQTNNMKSIMSTHLEYDEMKKDHEYEISNEELKDDDFGYCPKTCYNVGKILSSKLKKKNAISSLHSNWANIMHQPIDSMANNRGMRGSGRDFFGQKGYYIVYKKILDNEEILRKIVEILSDENISDQKRNDALSKVNYDFASCQEESLLEQVIFHVVDKVQRGGGREIYVMDFTTKLYQYPLEKMFKHICTWFEEELISIPSSKRANLIHSKIFDGSSKHTIYYLTLDCRKWAPRCSPEKYIYMLLGMADVLPDDFIKATISYFLKHEKKRIYTRKGIFDVFISNPNNQKYKKYFTNDEDVEGVYFTMPYSFVMGIFNLLSSLMHVGVQYYSKHIIETTICGSGEFVNINMFGHSDDSAGSCALSESRLMPWVLSTYEFISKQVNHLMSLKKCNVSTFYFELLSILYMNKQFLPLLAKFVQNVNFTPSGQGISSDFKEIISKSIELQTNGASINTAYNCQIILSNMYRKFYRITPDLQLPSLGGFVTTMPHLYLVYGANADEVRLFKYNYPTFNKILGYFNENLDYDVDDGMPMLKFKKQIRVPKKYEDLKNRISLPEFEDNQWFFNNNKTRHSGLNLYWFKAKMEDENFAVSLLNINEVKRYLDSLYMASGSNIKTLGKPANINEIINGILLSDKKFDTFKFETIIRSQYDGLILYMDFLDTHPKVGYKDKMPFYDKPCKLIMTKFNSMPVKNFDSLNLAVELSRPELKKYMYSKMTYGNELISVRNFLEDLGIPDDMISIKSFLDYMKKVQNKNITLYTRLPSDERVQYDEPGLHKYFLHSMNYKYSLEDTSHRLISPNKYTTVTLELESRIKDNLTAFLLYRSILGSRLEYLNDINLNNKFDNIRLADIYRFCLRDRDFVDFFTFLNFSIIRGTRDINMVGLNNISFWAKRQKRSGDNWSGIGNLIVKLEDSILSFEVLNNQIISCNHNLSFEKSFQSNSFFFISTLLSNMNIEWLVQNYDFSDNLSIGKDKNDRLCIGQNSQLGQIIPRCKYDPSLEFSMLNSNVSYSFINGMHTISYNNRSYKIETIDSVAISKYGLTEIFNVIDVELTDHELVSQLCGVVLTSNPKIESMITYDLGDLYEKFNGSELYRFLMKNMKRNSEKRLFIDKYFWSDIMQNIKSESEMMKTLGEQLGAEGAMSMIPDSNKSIMNRLMLYNIQDKDILKMRAKILKLPYNEQRDEIANILNQYGSDKTALVLLDDVGDYDQFCIHNFGGNMNEVPDSYFYNFFDCLTDAVSKCVSMISNNLLEEIVGDLLFTSSIVKEDFISTLPFFDLMTADKDANFLSDITIISNPLLSFLKVISLIFDDDDAIALFSDELALTTLRKFPRIPQFKDEWLILIFQMHKTLYKRFLESNKILPAVLLRYKKRLDTNLKGGSLLKLNWDQGGKKIFFNLDKKVEYENSSLYLPVKWSLTDTIKQFEDKPPISKLLMDEMLCPKFVESNQILQQEYLIEEFNVKLVKKKETVYHQQKGNKGKPNYKNDGEYMIALGPINLQLALNKNSFEKRWIPIITDTLIPNILSESLNIYKFGKDILNTKICTFLILDPSLSLPAKVQKENCIIRITKKQYISYSSSIDDIVLYRNSSTGIDFSDFDIIESVLGKSDPGEKTVSLEDINNAILECNYMPISFNPTMQSTYGKELFEAIVEQMKLSKIEQIDLMDIIKSKIPPISKYNKIRKLASNHNKVNDRSDFILGKVIEDILKGTDGFANEMRNKKEKAKYFISSTKSKSESKHRLFMLTSEKSSLKQLDDLTGGIAIDVLRKDVEIEDSLKDFFYNTLRDKQKNIPKDKPGFRALCGFYADLLLEIPPSDKTNKSGECLYKAISSFSSWTSIEEDSGEDYPDYEEPVYTGHVNLGLRR